MSTLSPFNLQHLVYLYDLLVDMARLKSAIWHWFVSHFFLGLISYLLLDYFSFVYLLVLWVSCVCFFVFLNIFKSKTNFSS